LKDKFENKKLIKKITKKIKIMRIKIKIKIKKLKIKTNSWLNGEIEKNNQFRKMIKKNKDQIRQNEIEWCN